MPTQKSSRSLSRYILCTIGISVLLAVVGIWVLGTVPTAQSTRSETAEATSIISSSSSAVYTAAVAFNTYRNEEWGFAFGYPKGWKVVENVDSSYHQFNLLLLPETGGYRDDPVSITINLPEYTATAFDTIEKTSEKILVGGIKGVQYQYDWEGDTKTAVVLPLGEYDILLGTNQHYPDLFAQVLDSFVFLRNPTREPAPPSTSDDMVSTTVFNVYRNEEWGFAFEYPEGWIPKEMTFGGYYSQFNVVLYPEVGLHYEDPVIFNIVLPEFAEKSFKHIEKTTEEVTIDGVNGIQYVYRWLDFLMTAIILPFGEHRLIIGTNQHYPNLFNHVINSFVFLPKEQVMTKKQVFSE